jgi:AmiR/NasT family two-component response regulator
MSTREVHQATGMIMAQLGVGAMVAFARLQASAFASGQLLTEVARDVVARLVRFDFDPDIGPDLDVAEPTW